MMMRIAGVAVAAGLLAYVGPAHAHIKMLKPTSAVQENASGGPQKDPPCGPGRTEGQGTPTDAVTTYMEGEEITVEWTETVPHNGHFRISLAKDPSEFKDPKVNGSCQSAEIQNPPVLPVLADGLFPSTSDDGKRMFSQKVKLPAGFTCDKCTLQLIQFMTPHPPSCFYYHCANIKIMPAGGAAAGSGGAGGAAGTPAAGSGSGAGGASAGAGAGGSVVMTTGGAGSAATATGGAGASAASTAAGSMSTAAPSTTATASAGKPATTTGSAGSATGTTSSPQTTTPAATPPAAMQSSGGCSATSARLRGNGLFGGLVVLGLAFAWRRRRSSRKQSTAPAAAA
ncbi:MAG TPA: SCE4755 family polysaccharide monooxygenase-like protein [Polyangiales bacterium]|nr:SCE4755 family polysaccharide monooxygenase-like protein [Polyangiales bacterium]